MLTATKVREGEKIRYGTLVRVKTTNLWGQAIEMKDPWISVEFITTTGATRRSYYRADELEVI